MRIATQLRDPKVSWTGLGVVARRSSKPVSCRRSTLFVASPRLLVLPPGHHFSCRWDASQCDQNPAAFGPRDSTSVRTTCASVGALSHMAASIELPLHSQSTLQSNLAGRHVCYESGWGIGRDRHIDRPGRLAHCSICSCSHCLRCNPVLLTCRFS